MYKYSDRNENDDISLHDCRATKIKINNGMVSFVFKDGFWVSERSRNNLKKTFFYTDEAEMRFKALYEDIDSSVTIYVFTETPEDNKAIREWIPFDTFAKQINGGMELEFLYSYKGYQSFIFECWLWFDEEPYHKECVMIISAKEITYHWNSLYAEEPYE